MFKPAALTFFVVTLVSSAVAQQCSEDRPVGLCCRYIEPFITNVPFFKGGCNVEVQNLATIMGIDCRTQLGAVW